MAQRVQYPGAQAFMPDRLELPLLRDAAARCQGCDLYRNATQTVFGAGPPHALALFVGEQPGDQEDLAGKPFVGPSGSMLNKALEEVGIPRAEIYVTNAVKHFKWTQRGKRRLHERPDVPEINACRPWIEAEIDAVLPRLIVCLGATAARSVFGREVKVTKERGRILEEEKGAARMVTVHPSSLLRAPDEAARLAAWHLFVADLRVAAEYLEHLGATSKRRVAGG